MNPRKVKSLAGRPPKDRDERRSELVQIKLTPPEARVLDEIVAARAVEISAATGGAAAHPTRSSVFRELFEAEAKRRGIAT
jgi:hypothetical protein